MNVSGEGEMEQVSVDQAPLESESDRLKARVTELETENAVLRDATHRAVAEVDRLTDVAAAHEETAKGFQAANAALSDALGSARDEVTRLGLQLTAAPAAAVSSQPAGYTGP